MIINATVFVAGQARLEIHYRDKTAELILQIPTIAPDDESTQMPQVCEPLLKEFAQAILADLGKPRGITWRHR